MTESTRTTTGANVFSKVPAFLTAFNNILENGFFNEIEFRIRASDNGKLSFCMLFVEGRIPSSIEHKVEGCGVIVNPREIIKKCREIVSTNKTRNIETSVKTADWPLWDDDETKVVGSKGQHIKMFLIITFAT